MRRWSVALLALLALLPVAAAQPEPDEVVARACALSPVDLPVCPPDEPAPAPAPAPAEAEAQAAPPATPEDAAQLADDVTEEVDGIVEDPASAPGRLASVVATLVQFVNDLLDLPAVAADALDAARAEAGASLAALVEDARARVAALFARAPAAPHAPVDAGVRAPVADDAAGLVDGLLQRVPSPMAR